MAELKWPLLKLQSNSPEVKVLQHLLTCRGHRTDISGHFDKHTEDAVKEFQKSVHLSPVDGQVGNDTWDYLTDNDSTIKENSNKPDCVKATQLELVKHNLLDPNAVDGKFGHHTTDAVKKFQKRVGGDQDGIVGPNTWKNLVCRKP
jgi:peptidoglycan hydrolase-like protein with peptidoglycan-binding domain